jgi:ElaB/YqjD/DUF883 family membrane-anchored ribosome-binding protein
MIAELFANHRNVGHKRQVLIDDLKSVADDADELLNEVTGATTDKLALARKDIEGRLTDARSRVERARNSLSGTAHETADIVYEYVAENPWKVVGVAAAATVAGVIVGVLANRR